MPKLTKSPANSSRGFLTHTHFLISRPSLQPIACRGQPLTLVHLQRQSAVRGAGRCVRGARRPAKSTLPRTRSARMKGRQARRGHLDSGSLSVSLSLLSSQLQTLVVSHQRYWSARPSVLPTGPVRLRSAALRQQPGRVNPTAAACTTGPRPHTSSSIAHLTQFPIYEFNVASILDSQIEHTRHTPNATKHTLPRNTHQTTTNSAVNVSTSHQPVLSCCGLFCKQDGGVHRIQRLPWRPLVLGAPGTGELQRLPAAPGGTDDDDAGERDQARTANDGPRLGGLEQARPATPPPNY